MSQSRLARFVSLAAVVLAFAAIVMPARGDAMAARISYRSAVVNVGGTSVTLSVGLTAADARYVNGPIQVVVTGPSRGSLSLVSADAAYNSHGFSVSFRRGAPAGTATFTVIIPSSRSASAEVDLSSTTGGAIGAPTATNQWVTVQTYQ